MARQPNAIRQRISLEGGDQIQRDLRELGKSGAAAFKAIEKAAGKDLASSFTRNLASIKRDLKPLGASFANLGRSLATVGRNLSLAFAGIGAATAGVVLFTKNATEAADAVGKAAQGVGLAAEEYQRLQFAAEQSGVAQADFVSGLTRLNQAIGRAAEGQETYLKRFEELGVAVRDANGQLRPTEAILGDLADAFAAMPENAAKAALGSDLFGRQIAKWLPLLNEGREGIAALGDEFDTTIGGFTEAQIRIATEMNDAFAAMSKAAERVRHQIGLAFAPSLLRGIRAFQDIIARNRQAIVGFAEDIARRVEPVVADLFNALTGNDAQVVDRRFLDWRDSIAEFGRDLAGVVTGFVMPAFRGIRAAADGVAAAVRTLSLGFVDFTGTQVLIGAASLKLTGGFRVLRDMIRLAAAALVFFGRHPVILGISAVAGGLAFLATRQDEAESAADTHRETIDELDDAIKRLRGDVPTAGEQLEALTQQHIDAAEAALRNAQAQLDFAEAARRGERGPGGVPSEQDRAIEQARAEVSGRLAKLDELRAKLDEVRVAAAKSDRELVDFTRTTEELGNAAAEAGEKVKNAFPGPAANVRSLAGNDPFAPVTEGAKEAGTAAEEAGATTRAALTETAASAGTLAENVRQVPVALTEAGAAAQTALEPVNTALAGIATTTAETAATVPSLFQEAASAIAAAFTTAFATIKSELAALQSAVTSAINAMTAALARLRAEIARTRAAAASSAGGGGGGGGFAEGGLFRGKGGVDQNLAWLTDYEFVMNPKAVRHWGVSFMQALNNLRTPTGFALGGLNLSGIGDRLTQSISAAAAIPAYATGGLNVAPASSGSANPFAGMARVDRLVIPGIGTTPAILPVDVVHTIKRHDQRKAFASTGRRQEFVR